ACVRGSFKRQPLPDLLPAFIGQVDELRSRFSFELAEPQDFTSCFERLGQNTGVMRQRHAAHDFKREVDLLAQGWRLGKLKSHAVLADVDEPAPTVFAKKSEYHAVAEPLPGSTAPLLRFCAFIRNCWRNRGHGHWATPASFSLRAGCITHSLAANLEAGPSHWGVPAADGWSDRRGRIPRHSRAVASRNSSSCRGKPSHLRLAS